MALAREQHESGKAKAPAAPVTKLVDQVAAAPGAVVDQVDEAATAPGAVVDKVDEAATAPGGVVDKAVSAPGGVVDKAVSAPGEVVDKVDEAAMAPGETVNKVTSAAQGGVAQLGRLTRELGKTLSPKRLLERAAVAATLALIRRHLGIVGAAAGTLVAVGAAGYFAGRHSHRTPRPM